MGIDGQHFEDRGTVGGKSSGRVPQTAFAKPIRDGGPTKRSVEDGSKERRLADRGNGQHLTAETMVAFVAERDRLLEAS